MVGTDQANSQRSQPFWLLIGTGKLLCFSAQSEAKMAATVWNWSGKTLSPGALLDVPHFSSCQIKPMTFQVPLTTELWATHMEGKSRVFG